MKREWRLRMGSRRAALSTLVLTAAIMVGGSATSQAQRQPATAIAQSTQTATPPVQRAAQPTTSLALQAKSDSNQLVPLFGWRDALLAVGFVGATYALFKVDEHVALRSQDQVTQANKFFKVLSKPSEYLAWPGGLVIEGGLYTVGKLRHRQRAAEVGWHGIEALVVAAGVTNVLKKTVGRSRPFVSADTNPHDFKFGGGFGNENRTSFPSGHTTSAFALAAAVASESRTKWPDKWWSAWLIPPALYTGATVVGLSRMYHNKHWASDVALGAAIGTFSGIKVIQYTHNHPNNFLDRVMLGTRVVPDGRGKVALAWSFPTP